MSIISSFLNTFIVPRYAVDTGNKRTFHISLTKAEEEARARGCDFVEDLKDGSTIDI